LRIPVRGNTFDIISIIMQRQIDTSILILLFAGLINITYSCKNKPGSITVTTAEVSVITQTSAISGGNTHARKSSSISARGVCWSTAIEPTILDNRTINGRDSGNFVSIVTGLRPRTVYYLRAYVISVTDTAYGNIVSFSTQEYGTVTDIEGNEYKTITIGTQIWMAKNLQTTRYNDGTVIPVVTDGAAWAALSTPAYCWYKNDEAAFKSTYGALYNWFTVNTGNLCPSGWHTPSDVEWTILTTNLGGENVAGGKLKEPGIGYWVAPNAGATNESGYSALPGGFRYHDGVFFDLGFSGYWWSSKQYNDSDAFFRFIYYQDSTVFRFNNRKRNGFSVRCLKD
jgi:uncharacterized protein (TIGR02145 family)